MEFWSVVGVLEMAVEKFVKDKALVYSHFDTDHSSPKCSVLKMEINEVSFYICENLGVKAYDTSGIL